MSLFNRPAWAKTQSNDNDEPDSASNIFSHADRSFRDIVAEQARKKKEKAERKKVKEERRSSGKREHDEVKPERDLHGSPKRRRITLQDGEKLLKSVGLSPRAAMSGEDAWQPVLIDDEEPVRRSPRINRHFNAQSPSKALRGSQLVDLGDDDGVRGDEVRHEDEIIYDPPPAEPVEIAEESDDEFAELARKARQARKQKEVNHKKSETPDIAGRSTSPGVEPPDTGYSSLPTPPPDPAVEILVTSPLPNTKPLIVHRKLSQSVQVIRKVWCNKQGFSEEMTRDVFLIHRMRKIYDATTCRSLGLDVDSFGNIVMKGEEGVEGAAKVHLLAVTEEIYQELKDEKARGVKRQSSELPSEEELEAEAAAEQAAAPEEPKEPQIRLTLKARGRKDFKLKVKPVRTRICTSVRLNRC